MRVHFVAGAALLWLALLTANASAATHFTLHVGAAPLEAVCAELDGAWNQGETGYSCATIDCDGAGGRCVIACLDPSECSGLIPKLKTPPAFSTGKAGIREILTFSPRG